MKKGLKIWWFYTSNSFQQLAANRLAMSIFMFGKLFRILLFFYFLNLIFFTAKSLGSYTPKQAILFYLVFNLIDTAAQLFFREVYRFRNLLISGDLDLVLVKPVNPLIRVLLGGADLLDALVLLILILILLFYVPANFLITWDIVFGFLLLFVGSFFISAAFHILILALGILFINIDHLVMIYRDITALMRIPVDVYITPISFFLTFILPLAIMFTFPAKSLMGLISWQVVLLCFAVSICLFLLANKFWLWSLRHYSSASS